MAYKVLGFDLSLGQSVATGIEVNDSTGALDAKGNDVDNVGQLDPDTFLFPRAASPAQTAEGSAVWDEGNNLLTIGTGATRKTVVDTDSAQSLTNKTIGAGSSYEASTIGESYGGTGQSAYAAGDLLYASGVDTLSRLAAGTNGHVLTLVAGIPAWQESGSANNAYATVNGDSGSATASGEDTLAVTGGDGLETTVSEGTPDGVVVDLVPDTTTGVTVAPLSVLAAGVGVSLDNDTIQHTAGTLSVGAGSIGANEVDETDSYTWTGAHDFTGGTISVQTPTLDSHAATKAYADGLAAGLDPKESARAATTDILDNAGNGTWTRAGTGPSHTLTAGTTGVTTIDGVSLDNDNRVLVKNEDGTGTNLTATDNGIYVVSDADAGSATVLTRADDFDGTPSGEVTGGNYCFVEQGTDNAGAGYVVMADGEITVDTDTIDFTQFSDPNVEAGVGMTKSGNTLHVGGGSTGDIGGLNFTADDLSLAYNSSFFNLVAEQLSILANAIGATEINETDNYAWTGNDEHAGTLDLSGATLTVPTTQQTPGGSSFQIDDVNSLAQSESAYTNQTAVYAADTGGVSVGDFVYLTSGGVVTQASASSQSEAAAALGLVIHAAAAGNYPHIVRWGEAEATFVGGLSPSVGDRAYLSTTSGELTTDVSGHGSGDSVFPVGIVDETLSYDGSANFTMRVQLQFGEPVYIA